MHKPLIVLPVVAVIAVLSSGCPSKAESCNPDGTVKVGLREESPSTERFIVRFRDEAEGRKLLSEAKGSVVLELGPQRSAAVRMPPAAAKALAKSGRFELVEEDPIRRPLAQTVPYGISMVEAPQAWTGSNPTSRKICIIDSGLRLSHEDLYTTGVTGDPGGWDQDECGHGTHVAGTIAAVDNAVGVVGVMPARPPLHIVQVFSGFECNWTYGSGLVEAVNDCVANDADVINMSLGGEQRSATEDRALSDAFRAGVLPVAAAGNDGTTGHSYPASYASVVSVAALDSTKTVANFSQKNSGVDLAAPGVDVNSLYPYENRAYTEINGTRYEGQPIEFTPESAGASGALVDGGLCEAAGDWTGKVVLCQRGSVTFAQKVASVQAGGGVAALIYNNVFGGFGGTLGPGGSSTIPALSLTQEHGNTLRPLAGSTALVVSLAPIASDAGYAELNGTSMASPHVAGVAALVWSHDATWSAGRVRNALENTAEDLGPTGRDDSYGFGLVQANAAVQYLKDAAGQPNVAPNADFTFSCTARACSFTDTSNDPDGSVSTWAWAFGDGAKSIYGAPSYTFGKDGTFQVTLTVTDDSGATASKTTPVTVKTPAVLSLTANFQGEDGGVRHAFLGWSDAKTQDVEIFRNDALLVKTLNDGVYEDATCIAGALTYKVCEPASSRCSEAIVAAPQ